MREILNDRYDPNCRASARNARNHLHEPGYFNKTMGPKFIAKVEDVTTAFGAKRKVIINRAATISR